MFGTTSSGSFTGLVLGLAVLGLYDTFSAGYESTKKVASKLGGAVAAALGCPRRKARAEVVTRAMVPYVSRDGAHSEALKEVVPRVRDSVSPLLLTNGDDVREETGPLTIQDSPQTLMLEDAPRTRAGRAIVTEKDALLEERAALSQELPLLDDQIRVLAGQDMRGAAPGVLIRHRDAISKLTVQRDAMAARIANLGDEIARLR